MEIKCLGTVDNQQKFTKMLLLGLWLMGNAGCLGSRAAGMDYPAKADPVSAYSSSAVQVDAYIIGPGDLLRLKLFDAPEMSGELSVLSDGSVSLPLVGSVVLSGLTLHQASGLIQELLSSQMLRPEAQLTVLTPRPILVSVVGAVEKPGVYALSAAKRKGDESSSSMSLLGFPTLVNAIQRAGGITQQADLRSVKLQRRLPGTPVRFKLARISNLVVDGVINSRTLICLMVTR